MTENHSSPSYKAFFLGPKSENEAWVRSEIQSILEHWFRWRKALFAADPEAITTAERRAPAYLEARENLSQHLEELNTLLAGEIPKYSPRYIGHMVSELALPAILGHLAALIHNPNNTVREVSRVGSQIEVEVVAMLAQMVGYDPDLATGHVTGGGTVANFEGLWRARYRQDHWLCLALYLDQEKGVELELYEAAHMGWPRFHALSAEHEIYEEDLRPLSAVAGNPFRFGDHMSRWLDKPYRGPVIMVPGNKHFSWAKGTNIFGLGEEAFWQVPLDAQGKLSVPGLKDLILKAQGEARPVLMVVSVAGTTETGEIDPIDQVQDLLDGLKREHGWDIWHHIDAAYGGFLCSMLRGEGANVLTPQNTAALEAIARAHSVTIDPHKLGYVPYSCGAFLVHDREAYAVSSFHAPYLEHHDVVEEKWSTTIEGSRSAAGATATWLTAKTLGLDAAGLGHVIASTIEAARAFRDDVVKALPSVRPLEPLDTNILCFSLAEDGDTLAEANAKTWAVYRAYAKGREFSVSETTLARDNYQALIEAHVASFGGACDADHLVLIRCVFMNPFWSEPGLRAHLTAEFIEDLKGLCQKD